MFILLGNLMEQFILVHNKKTRKQECRKLDHRRPCCFVCDKITLSNMLLESCETPGRQRSRHVEKHPVTSFKR